MRQLVIPSRYASPALALVATAVVVLSGCGRSRGRPDVVLVTLDTTRADHLGVYGSPRPVSPEIDRFARDAMLYRRAWSTASWTLPAHASLFTGRYPTSHGAHIREPGISGITMSYLPDDAVTLAEILRGAGYETAAFAAAGWLMPEFGLLQGYGVQDASANRPADALTDAAIGWIKGVSRERPIHLLVNYFDPHWPYTPPAGYDDLPLAKGPLTLPAVDPARGVSLTAEQRAAYLDHYDGEIRFMDHHLGRLLEALRAAGRYDDALIIVTADHGELFGEHGGFGHGAWLYEGVLRVPLLVRLPRGRRAGTVVDDAVSLVDVLPLIATELRLPLPPGVEGVPVGQRRLVFAEEARNEALMQFFGPAIDRDLVAAVCWPWKLIVPSTGPAELYRVDRDPDERGSASDAAEEKEIRQQLEATRAALVPAKVIPRRASPEVIEHLRALGYVQ